MWKYSVETDMDVTLFSGKGKSKLLIPGRVHLFNDNFLVCLCGELVCGQLGHMIVQNWPCWSQLSELSHWQHIYSLTPSPLLDPFSCSGLEEFKADLCGQKHDVPSLSCPWLLYEMYSQIYIYKTVTMKTNDRWREGIFVSLMGIWVLLLSKQSGFWNFCISLTSHRDTKKISSSLRPK